MRKEKELFLKAVWERIKGTDCIALDAVLEVAEKRHLEPEAAAKIVKGDVKLSELIREQAVGMRQIRAPAEA